MNSIENLQRNPPDQIERNPIVAILLDELVQVNGKKVEGHAHTASELKKIMDMNTVLQPVHIFHFDLI